MLDLQPRVHFEEEERFVLAGDELDRTGAVVTDSLRQCHGLLAHGFAGFFIEQRRRGFFEDFLIAALDRAFALAEIENVAVFVAEDLDFDVARVLDEFFDEAAVVAERRLGFRAGELEAFLGLRRIVGDAHPFAAAAGRRLDHHRIADLVRNLHRVLGVFNFAEVARNGRDLGKVGGFLGFDLVAHRGDGLRIRADENNAVLLQRGRERFTLRQEAVAGVDGFGARAFAGIDDLIHDEIGFRRGGWADVDGFIRHFDVQGIAVGI